MVWLSKLLWRLTPLMLLVGCGTTSKPEPRPGPPERVELNTIQAARVRKKVEPQTGVTSYSVLPDIPQSRSGELSLTTFLITGRGGPRPHDKGEFGFQVTSQKMRFNMCQLLTLKLDDKPLPPSPTRHFSSLGAGKVVEAVVAPVSAEVLSRMARAGRVEYELCGTRGQLTGLDLALLRKLVSLWPKSPDPGPTQPR